MASSCDRLCPRPRRPKVSAWRRAGYAADPTLEAGHEVAAEIASGGIGEAPLLIDQLVDAADVRLRLLHHRHVEKHERLPQVMVRTEGAHRAGSTAHHGTRLAVPGA